MTATQVVGEKAARRVSPAFFVLAVVCFFFTFAGVSCNTDAARQVASGVSGFSGSGVSTAQLNSCLDAINGVDLFSYSGFNLAFGGAPSGLTTAPAACLQGQSSLPSSDSAVPPANQVAIGVQPLALAALICIALAVVAGILALFRLIRGPLRAGLVTLLGIAAFGLILFEQAHARQAIIDRINAAASGNSNGLQLSLGSFLAVNSGIAYVLVLVALGVAVLFNLISAFFGAPDPPDAGVPPASPPPELQPAAPG